MITWLIASGGLRTCLHFFNSYSLLTGLLGAEVNAEIENAAAKHDEPEAKHKGERTSSSEKNKEPAA